MKLQLGLGSLLIALAPGCAKTSGGSTFAPIPGVADSVSAEPDALLQAARQSVQGQDWAQAAQLYGQVLRANPDSRQRQEALEGLAQTRRAVGDCSGSNRALTTLLELADAKLDVASRQRLLYERGICYAELLDWERCQQDLEAALVLKHDPGLARRMELHARRGLALFHLNQLDEATREFEAGLALHRALDSEVRERLADPYFLAMSHFYLGAIAHRRFTQITLNLPETRMAKELEQKVQLIEQLQSHYHDAIRVRHVFWVSAAGYQLGAAFERFYDEMMQSPVPPRLSPAQRAVFYSELKKKIRPVLLRAVDVYEKNLAAAKRIGYTTPFVEDTKARLAQLRSYLVSEMSTGPFAPPPLEKREPGSEPSSQVTAQAEFIPTPTPL